MSGATEGQERAKRTAPKNLKKCQQVIGIQHSGADRIVVFGPQEPSAPTVEGETVSEVTADGVTLEAEINSRSEGGEAPTRYSFQYGRCISASSCTQSHYEASVPVPNGSRDTGCEHPYRGVYSRMSAVAFTIILILLAHKVVWAVRMCVSVVRVLPSQLLYRSWFGFDSR